MSHRKPKARKIPKKPRAGASAEVLRNWIKRADEVKADNARKLRNYESEKVARKKLKDRVRNYRR